MKGRAHTRVRRRYLFAGGLALLLLVGVLSLTSLPSGGSACPPILSGAVSKTQLTSVSFGGVTTFSLPSPSRSPNAIKVAADGSIWFGEEAVPALAHLYPDNGTLVEYKFPGSYQASASQGYGCSEKTEIWGVALWDNRVWATDYVQNRLVGLSPASGTFETVTLSKAGSGPYTLTPGPDGALWFTQIESGEIGTLFANGTVLEHAVVVPEYLNGTLNPIEVQGTPAQVAFANVTTGYYVDASPLLNGSPIFEFNPTRFGAERVGSGVSNLSDPDSLSLGDGGIWLAQHSDSSVAYYDAGDGNWTIYPTSAVPYIGTTLPYFVEANDSLVWFNEHYGNRIAVLDASKKTLTEYSLSDPPAGNMSQIVNALTLDLGGGRAWFTETTGNAVGYVSASYRPSFSVSAENSSLSLRQGQTRTIQVELEGSSSSPISVGLTEVGPGNSRDGNVTMQTNETQVLSLAGNRTLDVTVGIATSALPGDYTLLVTGSDGLTSRSVFIELKVLAPDPP